MTTLCLQVFFRNIIHFNFQWILEVNRVMLQIMFWAGAASEIGAEGHIRFELLRDSSRPVIKKIMQLVEFLINCLFFILIVIQGPTLIKLGRMTSFSTIPFNYVWIYTPVFVFGVLALLFSFLKCLELLTMKSIKL